MDHSCWLQNSCRVCGGKLGRYKVSYDCHTDTNQAKLQAIGVSVKTDRKKTHPLKFCHGCYNVCTRKLSANKAGRDYFPSLALTKFEWVDHRDSDCTVCQHFGKSARDRRQKKPLVPIGRPSDSFLEMIASIKERAPPSLLLDFDVRERLSRHPSTDEDVKCPLCHLVLDRPVNLATCNKLVCLTCCIGHLYRHTDLSCPCCGIGHTVDSSTIIPAPTVVQKLLQAMELPCERCQQSVLAGTQQSNNTHSKNINLPNAFLVRFSEHTCTDNQYPQSVDEVVATPLDVPLSRQEDRLATSLVRRKIAQGSPNGLVQFKTGGQVIQPINTTIM